MYAGIFAVHYVKNMAMKEHHSGTNMSQMELLITKCTRSMGFHNPVRHQDWNSTAMYGYY